MPKKDRPTGPAAVALGLDLLQRGRLPEATTVLERAVAAAPGNVEARFLLANALAAGGELDQAIGHYRRVAALTPDRANAHVNLGNALYERGDLAGAASSLNRAQTLDPRDPEIPHNLGNVLVSAGRIEEAKECYRRALALRPDFASAHEALGRIKKYAPDDPDLSSLERLAARRDLPEGERSSALFGFAKALDDSGDYARAFAVLTKANAHERARRHFSIDAFAALCRDVIARFDEAAFARAAGAGYSSDRPIFIVGMPRSGTTLIEQILAAHPDVAGGGELLVLPRLIDRIAATAGGSAAWPQRIAGASAADLEAWGRTYIEGLDRVVPKAPRATDKLPANFLHVGMIRMILPNAAIVHCRRDPVATCFSCYQHHFTAAVDFAFDLGELGRYYRLYDDVMAHWNRVLPGRIHEVRYEDVVADRQGETRRLLDHLGLPWDDAVADFHKTERPVMTASAAQVRRPIYGGAVAHWRHYQPFLKPLLDALGPLAPTEALQ